MKARPVLIGILATAATPTFGALAAAYPWHSVSFKDWVVSVIADWSPMIVFIVFWILYMGVYGSRRRPWQKEYFARQEKHMDRLEAQLERIAAALEQRGGPQR